MIEKQPLRGQVKDSTKKYVFLRFKNSFKFVGVQETMYLLFNLYHYIFTTYP